MRKTRLAHLTKLAQQFGLPGVGETDYSGLEAEKEVKRLDLSDVDFDRLAPEAKRAIGDIRKIIIWELKNSPEFLKKQIVDAVIDEANVNIYTLLNEYLPKIPELQAQLPAETKQLTLPGTPPDIRFLPTEEGILEDKVRLNEYVAEQEIARQKQIEEYDRDAAVVIEEYKQTHEGKEPSNWELNTLMKYRKRDPFDDNYGAGGEVKRIQEAPEKADLEPMSQDQYGAALKKLYRVYNEIQKNYVELEQLEANLAGMNVKKDEILEIDPASFKTYREMIYDLRDRTLVSLHNIVADSVGYTLFGASSGRNSSWRHDTGTAIFDGQDHEWLGSPDKLKEFLEKVPRVFDRKDEFWRSWGGQSNDVRFWFNQKYNALVNHNDSLKRAKVSFKKGVNFIKTMNVKLPASLESVFAMDSFAVFGEYIETDEKYRNDLNTLYHHIVGRIRDTTGVASRTQAHYNNGMYKDQGYYNSSGTETPEFNFSQMMAAKKTTQADMLSSLTKLLFSSVKTISNGIVKNELEPLFDRIANEFASDFCEEKLGVKMSEIPRVKERYGRNFKVVIGDPQTTKLADAWIKFASSNNLPDNYQSLIRYPEFLFKGNKDMIELAQTSIRERLGYRVGEWLLSEPVRLFSSAIRDVAALPSFRYNGEDGFRKEIVAKKEEFFKLVIMKATLKVRSADLLDSEVAEQAIVPERYKPLETMFNTAIENIKRDIPEQRSPYNKKNYAETLESNSRFDTGPTKYIIKLMDNPSTLDDTSLRVLTYDLYNEINSLLDNSPPGSRNLMDEGMFLSGRPLLRYRSLILHSLLTAFSVDTAIDSLQELRVPENLIQMDIADIAAKDYNLRQMYNADPANATEIVKDLLIKQESFNKQINAWIDKAIELRKMLAAVMEKMKTEDNIAKIFSKRMNKFSGVGPNAIDNKIKSVVQANPDIAHLPLSQLFRKANEETTKAMGSKEPLVKDPTVLLYDHLFDSDGYSTTMAHAIAVISKALDLKAPEQVENLIALTEKKMTDNISKEEIDYIFPALITNKNAIEQQLERAISLSSFAHNDGAGMTKEQILSFGKNANFKDWIDDVDAIKHFFSIYMKIKRAGSGRAFYAQNKQVIKSLLANKTISPGPQRRFELIQQAFENNTRINPSIEGFASIRELINKTKYDIDAIEKFATFSKYNTQIEEQKLHKDPQLFKLNWNMGNNKFRFRVLKTFDPFHFQVGVETGCCQKLGGVGEAAAIDSYINPLAGVVVFEVLVDSSYELVCQSYFHYVPKDNGIILDNVENTDLDGDQVKEITGYTTEQIYAWWAQVKKGQQDYAYFLCGTSYNKLDNDQFGRDKRKEDPRDFKYDRVYTDYDEDNSVDLLKPKFELPDTMELRKKKTEKRKKSIWELNLFFKDAYV